MRGRRLLAVLTASLLGAASIAGGAQAATFQEVERASLEKMKQQILESPEQEPTSTGHVGLNVKVEEMGRAIAGMLLPVDISWLDNVDIAVDSGIAEKELNGVITASVNGVKALAANMQIDLNTMDMKVQIPQLSEGVLAGNYADAMTVTAGAAGEEEEVPMTPENYADMMQISTNLGQNPPDNATLAALAERYLTIVYDAFEEGESGTDTISIDGYTLDCETVTGIIRQEKAVEMGRTILSTAREDAELKTVIENAAAGTSSEENAYASFQEAIDKALAEIDKPEEETAGGEEASAPTDMALTLWVNGEGETVGFAVEEASGANTQIIKALYPSTDEWSALDVQMNADVNEAPSTMGLTGSGTKADGKLTGTYHFIMDGTVMADIAAEQTSDKEAHTFDGTYVITPVEAEGEEGSSNPLSGFGMKATVHTEQNAGQIDLGIQMSGSDLITASLRSLNDNEPVAVEIPEGTQTYALDNDEAMGTYVSTIDPTGVFAALAEAGMPEDFPEQIMSMMSGSSESGDEYTDDASDYEEGEEEPAA